MEIGIKKCNLEVKRLYLPVKVNVPCFYCDNVIEYDFDEQYLSYPTTGVEERCTAYCDCCEGETGFAVQLNMTLIYDSFKTTGEYKGS